MKVIGHYRQIIAGGMGEPLYGRIPYYAKRRHYLPLVRRVALQIKIMFLGSLMWINVNESDLC